MSAGRDDPGRRGWHTGPQGDEPGWLALSDDELLYRIEALPDDHDSDEVLFAVVESERHFFIRQEAAKRIRDRERLKRHAGDRHIGQILVRGLTRDEDAAYLRALIERSRHLEVRKAAEAQLSRLLEARRPGEGDPA